MIFVRLITYLIGVIIFSLGIALTIQMQHLGVHPWDVLNVGMYNLFGFTVGTWNILIGLFLIVVTLILDRQYVKFGTVFNVVFIGIFVDVFLLSGILPDPSSLWIDIIVMLAGIVIMGIGGGLYNAAKVGAGPRDGFMLAISDRTGASIRKVRIITETTVLLIGILIGGPVFIVTFIFTFIQSPIFQYFYLKFLHFFERIEIKLGRRKSPTM